jgi:MFS family permease
MSAERLRAHLRRPAATRRAAADLLGRRRVFMAGAVFSTTASLLCGLAWSPAALLAARVVQSAGAAIMTPTALSIISTTFTEGSERNKALGIWGALAASAPPPRS